MGRNAERLAGVIIETCSNSSDCSSFLSEVGGEVMSFELLRGKRCWRFRERGSERALEGEWTWKVGCQGPRGPLEVCGNN